MIRLALVVLAVALAWLAAEAGEAPQPRSSVGALPVADAPLLGIVDRLSLARLSPRTLRAPGRKIPLRGYQWGSAWSPDRKRFVVGVSSRGRLQFVDVARWRPGGLLELGERTSLPYVAWPAADRVVAISTESEAWTVDPVARRVVQRDALDGQVIDAVTAARGLVALVVPREGVAPVRLAVLEGNGSARLVDIPDVRGGYGPMRDDHSRREVRPAVTVQGDRAFVVAAQKLLVVEVDLATGETASHDLTAAPSLASRLLDLIEEPAYAKGAFGPVRIARMAGDDLLAVSGQLWSRNRPNPMGLTYIDTERWAIREVDPEAHWLGVASGRVLVWPQGERRGPGVIAYGLDGHRAWTAMRARQVVRLESAGRYVYATRFRPNRTYVFDARSGREVGMLETANGPVLLARP